MSYFSSTMHSMPDTNLNYS